MAMMTETTPARNLRVRYATFHREPGYAIRTQDRRVLFVDHDAQCQVLRDGDIPALVLLGNVALAEAQALADFLAGGVAGICVSRRQEVA